MHYSPNKTSPIFRQSTDVEFPDILVTERALAQHWSISVKKLQADRAAGKGCPFVRIGRAVRYRASDIAMYEAANARNSTLGG